MNIDMICHCGAPYIAKSADLKRGWGYSCDKHCAAVRRDFGRPRAKPANGKHIQQNKKKPDSLRPNDHRHDNDNFEYSEHPFSIEAFHDPMTGNYADGGGNEP